jgi:Bacterial Ig-like domain (group 3)
LLAVFSVLPPVVLHAFAPRHQWLVRRKGFCRRIASIHLTTSIHLTAAIVFAAVLLQGGAAGAQSTIIDEPSVVTLTASNLTGEAGSLTLTAAVTTKQGNGVPGGTIRFFDESTMAVLGWADVTAPSVTISHLTMGRHLIRADYSGTADFLPMVVLPSQSALLSRTVLATPDVTVSSSQNPSAPGELVTLTAVVSSIDSVPRGTVTFSDGRSVIAAHVGLDRSGIASFTTSALLDGLRAIVVVYEGDGEHAPAVSPRLVQDVGGLRIRDTMLVH